LTNNLTIGDEYQLTVYLKEYGMSEVQTDTVSLNVIEKTTEHHDVQIDKSRSSHIIDTYESKIRVDFL
jgi:hypothetical protein